MPIRDDLPFATDEEIKLLATMTGQITKTEKKLAIMRWKRRKLYDMIRKRKMSPGSRKPRINLNPTPPKKMLIPYAGKEITRRGKRSDHNFPTA